jgi:hypothetical protein
MAILTTLGKDLERKSRPGMLGRLFARAYVAVNPSRVAVVSVDDLSESFQDAQLNAIADERADGPFVKVNVSDL